MLEFNLNWDNGHKYWDVYEVHTDCENSDDWVFERTWGRNLRWSAYNAKTNKTVSHYVSNKYNHIEVSDGSYADQVQANKVYWAKHYAAKRKAAAEREAAMTPEERAACKALNDSIPF